MRRIAGPLGIVASNALAYNSGVLQTLHDEWNLSMPGMVKRSEATAQAISPKAWRFVGEMEQISATFNDRFPGDHAGAAQLYAQLSEFKDQPPASLCAVGGAEFIQ